VRHMSVITKLGAATLAVAVAPPVSYSPTQSLSSTQLAVVSDTGSYVDPRDGETYRWVRIGEQVWMAENLKYVPTEGSWCWENDDEQCKIRGRFYTWDVAQLVAPPGWHVATDEDWKALEVSVGIDVADLDKVGDRGDHQGAAGGALKAVGRWVTEHNGQSITITGETGFGAIPTGVYALDEFNHAGYAVWWTSTGEGGVGWIRVLRFFDNRIDRLLNNKALGYAVRCVRDEHD